MRKWVVGGAAVAVSLASAGAPAAAAAPTGGFAVFDQCPVHDEQVLTCIYGPVEGGYLTLGKTVVPIAKTLALQGGLLEGSEGAHPFAAALDGETMTKAGLVLPGGLFGRPLDAVAELAGPASSVLFILPEGPMRVVLPIKVRLVNPLLGAECSIGSNSHPIALNLTAGTSGQLTGNPGEINLLESEVGVFRGVSLVDSGFAAPKAGGCGSALVDEAVNAKLGLPLSKGTAAVFDMKIYVSARNSVEKSEG